MFLLTTFTIFINGMIIRNPFHSMQKISQLGDINLVFLPV